MIADLFVCIKAERPSHQFLVMSGQSYRFLVSWVLSSTVGSQCALLKDTTRCRQCGSNSGPLNLKSDALQLCHRDPNPHINTSLWIQHDEAIGFNSVLDI